MMTHSKDEDVFKVSSCFLGSRLTDNGERFLTGLFIEYRSFSEHIYRVEFQMQEILKKNERA